MSNPLSQELLEQLSELASVQVGLHFPPDRREDLARGILAVAAEQGFKDVNVFAARLLSEPPSQATLEMLASHLTVGETYFFREKRALEAFEERIIPEFVRQRREGERRLRVWCAGCSTGEEPYTIAILIRKLIPDLASWDISILATDINTQVLQKARAAKYSQWSFRETPERIKATCFQPAGDGRLELISEIRSMVTFSSLNLAIDPYPPLANGAGDIDIIFCRNVLMYFSAQAAQKVARRFYQSLVEGGWLVVSANEVSRQIFGEFERIDFSGATLYRRTAIAWKPAVKTVRRDDRINGDDADGSILNGHQKRNLSRAPGKPAAAPKHDKRAISDHSPKAAQTYEDALALYAYGQYDAAVQMLKEILLRDRGHASAYALLSRISANQGRLEDASASCAQAIALDGLNAGNHYLQATIRQEQGLIQEAVQSLKRAVYLDPHFVMAYFTLGNLAISRGNKTEARRQMDNALRLLDTYDQKKPLPESEGMTPDRLRQIIVAVADGM